MRKIPPVRQYDGYVPAMLEHLRAGDLFLLVVTPDLVCDGKVVDTSKCSVRVSYTEIDKKAQQVKKSAENAWAPSTEVIVRGNNNELQFGQVHRGPVLESVSGEAIGQVTGVRGCVARGASGAGESGKGVRSHKRKVADFRRRMREKFPSQPAQKP